LHPNEDTESNNLNPGPINIDEDNGIINISGGMIDSTKQPLQSPPQLGLSMYSPQYTMIVTPTVDIGPNIRYPDHEFPLLDFNCDCDQNDKEKYRHSLCQNASVPWHLFHQKTSLEGSQKTSSLSVEKKNLL